MEILNIDGTALPAPSAYKVQLSDLDSNGTGRTEDGVLVRERVRGGVAKISAGWAALSTADCAKVLNATAPDSMTVQYFFGGVRTAKMYAGDRTADLKAARDGEITRLNAFIGGNPVFTTLPAEEQARLRRQLDVMRELSVILGERIAAFF